MTNRLTKDTWIRAGLATLASSGIGAIKVGPMAKGLNVSRGSFYWHFEDISRFHSAMLDAWEEKSTGEVIEQTDPKSGESALLTLISKGFSDDRMLDSAVRGWAIEDERVALRVANVDQRRIDHICSLLINCGLDRKRASRRSTFLYWAYLGQLTPRSDANDIGELADEFRRMLLS